MKHLPYTIDEQRQRFHYYENLWKKVSLELLERHAGSLEGWRLLDYGSGRGETMDYASRLGMIPYGLDPDPICVKLSSRFGKADLLDVAQANLQLKPKTYDAIACLHVLEHVDNPKELLTYLGRAATRYVVVAVPNLQKIPNLRKPWASPGSVNEGHLQSWDHAHFRNLAERHCHLKVIAWANDVTIVPIASELTRRLLGNKAVIHLETTVFRRLFPYWGNSIIALLAPTSTGHCSNL